MNLQEFLQKLKQHGIENEIPNISLENAEFLLEQIKQIKAKNILEIGTANGYSTIHFANCIQEWDGKITTIEFSSLSYEAAKKNFEEVWLSNITQLLGNALSILPELKETYDFIFIDGMKKRSRDFLELCLPKIKKWWIIVIDDVIKFKHKMESLYEFVETQKLPYEIIQIDQDDGIMMFRF